MAYTDPRARGFNYGAGWHGPFPPIYLIAQRFARQLGKDATSAHDRAWALEMKLRAVRLAHTAPEKARAVQQLDKVMQQYLLPASDNDA